jgi:uncharacterized protein YciI
MQHFMVEITYTIPISELGDSQINEHRQFLQTGYERGLLLMSGPQFPPLGGIVVGRAESLDTLQQFFQDDPYFKRGLATYRFVEFRPVKHAGFLADRVNGAF